MTIDSSRPILFNITIDGSGFTGSAPADGFIDPIKAEKYAAIYTVTGTVSAPTVTAGDVIFVNGVSITFVSGATALADIVTAINAFTDSHHAVASDVGGYLVLTDENYFEGNSIVVTGLPAVLTEIGFVAPVVSAIPGAFPSTLANGEAKARGNERWKLVTEQLSRDTSPLYVAAIVETGNNVNTQPSAISFTASYTDVSFVYTYDETNNNAILNGIPAIIRCVARALMVDKFMNVVVYDPTHDTTGNPKGDVIEYLEIGALTTDLATAEAAVSVTVIANVR